MDGSVILGQGIHRRTELMDQDREYSVVKVCRIRTENSVQDRIVGLVQCMKGQNCWIRTRNKLKKERNMIYNGFVGFRQEYNVGQVFWIRTEYSVGQVCWIRTRNTVQGRFVGLGQEYICNYISQTHIRRNPLSPSKTRSYKQTYISNLETRQFQ